MISTSAPFSRSMVAVSVRPEAAAQDNSVNEVQLPLMPKGVEHLNEEAI